MRAGKRTRRASWESPTGNDRRYGYDQAWRGYYSDRWFGRRQFNSAVAPLISRLTRYDRLRWEIEEHGGTLELPVRIIETLSEKFVVPGLNRSYEVALADQESLRLMLHDLGDYDCRLQVRRRATGMPVYYFCRTLSDYRSTYSLILEDLYQSPGYPISDERFVKIMRRGHEVYYLRLSMFRKKTLAMLDKEKSRNSQDAVDEILEKAGRGIFQAAWHEDQHVGMAAAEHFGLTRFRQAIELLYLCLSGDLCELRRTVNKEMLQFFIEVYPQPAIHDFLGLLNDLDGEALTRVPQAALKLYPRLSRDFSSFLSIEMPWGRWKTPMPLYKLLFGNFSRLEAVRKGIGANGELKKAAEHLEKQSRAMIRALFDGAKAPAVSDAGNGLSAGAEA